MQAVIIWTLMGGLLIFALGLTSAISSRKQAKQTKLAAEAATKIIVLPPQVYAYPPVKKESKPQSEMSMAESGGSLNGKENLASIGSTSS